MTRPQEIKQSKRPTTSRRWLLILLVVAALWWMVGIRTKPTTPVAPVASPVTSFTTPIPQAGDVAPTVQSVARLGAGRATQVAFDRQQTRVAVATAIGVYLYDVQGFTRLGFQEIRAPVQTVAFSPDGTALAFSTSGPHAQLYQWRLADNALTVQTLDEPLIHGLAFSPDGAYLVGATFYHLLIWSAVDRKLLLAHEQPGALHKNIAFSPSGRLVVALSRDRLELWRLGENRLLQTITPQPGRYFSTETVAFAPTGAHLAVAGLRESILYRWRVTEQDGLTAATEERIGDDTGVIADFQFAPDSERIAIGLSDGTVAIHSVTTPMTATVTAPLAAAVERVAWSADGAFVAAGVADRSVHIWSGARMAAHQAVMLPPPATVSQMHHLQFVEAQKGIAVVLANGALYQWRLADGQLLHSLEEHSLGQIHSVGFTPDGAQVVIGAEYGSIQFWARARRLPVSTYHTSAGHVDAVAVSPDGTQLAAAFSRPLALGVWADPIQLVSAPAAAGAQPVWPVADGSAVTTLDTDDTGFVTTCGVFWNSVAFSQDGAYLAASSYAHKALLWRRADHTLLHQLEGHASAILDLAFSPDSTLVATASDDEEVRLWQVSDGKVRYVLPGHAGGAVAVAFSPDGQLLATRAGLGDIRLWRVRDGQVLGDALANVKNPRSNLAFSPDGAWLATGGQDNNAYLWSVADRTLVAVLQGHNGLVNGVAFAPDGAQLATAAEDGTVVIWALPTVQQ